MPHSISLTTAEAACLNALRAGHERKSHIAMETGLTAQRVRQALTALAEHDLVTTVHFRTCHLTPLGREVTIAIEPTARTRGRPSGNGGAPGPSALRLLALLDRPRRGADLVRLMGVTRQRIHQIVAKLAALGLARVADPIWPLFLVARDDDASILLRMGQERVLSAFPDTAATTVSRIAEAARIPMRDAADLTQSLRQIGLVEQVGTAVHTDLYRLTPTGAAHHQRSATERRADPPSLPFRSDRVRAVLSHLDRHGPIRTRDVGYALDIAQQSMNALMQNLKRKGMVRTQSNARNAPYILTPVGVDTLVAMQNQTASGTGMG